MQHAADMGGIIGHPTGVSDHLNDPLARPHLAPKAVGRGSTVEQGRQLGTLFGGELWRTARGRMRPQPFLHPFHSRPRQPLAHGSRRDAQSGGDLCLFPARLFQLPGASPPSFTPVQPGLCGLHDPSLPYV